MGLIKNAVTQGLQVADRLAEVVAAGGTRCWWSAPGRPAWPRRSGSRRRGSRYRDRRAGDGGRLGGPLPAPQGGDDRAGGAPLPRRASARSSSPRRSCWPGGSRSSRRPGCASSRASRWRASPGRTAPSRSQTSAGTVTAAKVVLAIGRRGTPRKLGVPGEELREGPLRPHATRSSSTGPAGPGGGRRRLGARGGHPARHRVHRPGHPELPQRRARALPRGQPDPLRAQLVAEGKVTALMPSQVQAIGPDEVLLEVGGGPRQLPNDFVIVNIGGELPVEFLQKAGVSMRRFHGEAPGRPQAEPQGASGATPAPPRTWRCSAGSRRCAFLYAGGRGGHPGLPGLEGGRVLPARRGSSGSARRSTRRSARPARGATAWASWPPPSCSPTSSTRSASGPGS